MSDQDLAERLANKELGAIDEFYRAYRPRIFAVASKYGRNHWDAEEIVQDVVWTVYRKAHTFKGNSAFSTWVYRISENATRMHLRKHKRAPNPVESDVLEYMIENDDAAPSSPLPDQVLAVQRVQNELVAELADVDEVNRAIYYEMDVEDRSKEEVAKRHGLTVSAVKSRLHRIRARLRDVAEVTA